MTEPRSIREAIDQVQKFARPSEGADQDTTVNAASGRNLAGSAESRPATVAAESSAPSHGRAWPTAPCRHCASEVIHARGIDLVIRTIEPTPSPSGACRLHHSGDPSRHVTVEILTHPEILAALNADERLVLHELHAGHCPAVRCGRGRS